MKTIVISAVNLVEAGTLAILKDCLSYLSGLAAGGEYRIVAIVHKKELVDFPNIDYIETQWPKKRWINRLWYEYVSMKGISKSIGPVYLWFSLHDTTPTVVAERRAVYCHNAFPFYKWKLHDLVFAPKIMLFALFSKYIYKPNIRRNTHVVVQQGWLRTALSQMFSLDQRKVIVAPPAQKTTTFQTTEKDKSSGDYSFVFAGSPNSHKNFEVLCRAAEQLEKQGIVNFKIHITVKGDENKYARWLHKKWGHLQTVNFMGFVSRATLQQYYVDSDCLLYPSKVESWGLPISEFGQLNKPMLLADLPYAHDTAAGNEYVAYFNPEDATDLAQKIKSILVEDRSILKKIAATRLPAPSAGNWDQIFKILLG
ncbi:glycosyltransferase family 4 protein [Sphingobacterium kitahiroshimense]|uniref:Glycosyltransferase family 1 protein n=1 Tax=Sphingobacterium kitahiroshimense TaxID=470446 RepID=A0ABV0BY82_9SPHI